MIKIEVRSHWFLVIRASMVIHFGKNPVRGGRPPNDKIHNISIYILDMEVLDKEENSLGDFFDILFIINIIGEIIIM